ncbi:MAG TPA: MFS transporter [Xanthobacteraceae bacterium]|jgi:predicted MFS family arabinose efflux permease
MLMRASITDGGAIDRVKRWAERKAGGPARLQVIILLAGVLGLDGADKATVSAVAASLKDVFGIGNTEIGVLIAVTSFVGAIFTLPIGVLVDRIERQKILVCAVALWTLAMVVSGFAGSFTFLLIARACLGAVTAAAAPTVASMTGDFFPPRARGDVYGMILAGELVGTGIGFFIGGELESLLNWRWSFFLIALPSVLLIWAIWRFLPEPARGGQSWIEVGQRDLTTEQGTAYARRRHGNSSSAIGRTQEAVQRAGVQPREDLILRGDPSRRSLWWALRYLIKIPTYVLLIIASALGYYFFAGIRAFAMVYLTQHYHVSASTVSALVIVVGLGAIMGVILGGRSSSWLLEKGVLDARIVVPGVALLIAVVLIAPAIWTRSAVIGTALLAFGAAALAAANAPIDAARLDIIHPRLWGRAEAGRMAIRAALQGGAPIVFGWVSGMLGGGDRGLEWTYLLMLIPVLAAASLAIPARHTYLRDVATAAASVKATSP